MPPEFTVLSAVRKHMRDQYGVVDWLEPLVYHRIMRGDTKRDVFGYLWMNMSGGTAAERVTDRIYQELGLER